MPEITRQDIELWVSTVATGEFHYKDIKGLRSELTPELDNKLRKIVFDICHAADPKCESIGKKDGWYRPIEDGVKPIDIISPLLLFPQCVFSPAVYMVNGKTSNVFLAAFNTG